MAFFDFLKTAKKNTVHEVQSFYELSAKTIEGEIFDFPSLKGKKVLIVNVASKCGFTPQYEDLEKLYKEFESSDFTILGFPCNDFLRQESGTEEEIKTFCQLTYGVSFPMMSKVKVKGSDKSPVYEWLTNKELNGVMNSKVTWNFQKYMISSEGKLLGHASPNEKPYSTKILNFIKS